MSGTQKVSIVAGTEEAKEERLKMKCERQVGASLFGAVKSVQLVCTWAAVLQTAGWLSVIRKRAVQM